MPKERRWQGGAKNRRIVCGLHLCKVLLPEFQGPLRADSDKVLMFSSSPSTLLHYRTLPLFFLHAPSCPTLEPGLMTTSSLPFPLKTVCPGSSEISQNYLPSPWQNIYTPCRNLLAVASLFLKPHKKHTWQMFRYLGIPLGIFNTFSNCFLMSW